jgi:hypothetical protein
MAGATLFSAWLAFATLFILRAQAEWDVLAPDYDAWKELARRQAPADQATTTTSVSPYPSSTGCAGLASYGGNGATYTTTSGVLYTLYCGLVPLPIFYDARAGDADIVDCLSSCDIDPDCGAAYLIQQVCYYSETPTSLETGDDPETVLAVRAASPDPYPDLSSSSSIDPSTATSSSVEVPPIYPYVTT